MAYSKVPDNCPNCGEYQSFDILGGQKVVSDSKYSMGKGILGTAVLGPIGAVAGIGGKKTYDHIYTCKRCGHQITVHYSDNS